ncbi:MAG: exonuclease domain-containing protein [Clostridiales bacterium]|nr:exonuclease domain-containing protein [Clostridiales bacterium]
MYYIALDFEFNQPFHFKTGVKTNLEPECPFEIIQIGAVKLNESFQEIDRFNYYIRPQVYPRLHPFVEKITGITMDQLQNQPSFAEAYGAFCRFAGKDSILCTWGMDDIRFLFTNILYYRLDASLITNHCINVQKYASAFLNCSAGNAIGLKNAVTALEIPVEEEFHNALYDAYYTGRVFQMIFTSKIEAVSYHWQELCPQKNKRPMIDTGRLYAHFGDLLGREVTKEEQALIKTAYKLGRNQSFDALEKHKVSKKRKRSRSKNEDINSLSQYHR